MSKAKEKKTDSQAQVTDFESAMANLEALVERLETGELSLEESLSAFEQGVKLTREVQRALAEAEQKVQVLLEEKGKPLSTGYQEAEDSP